MLISAAAGKFNIFFYSERIKAFHRTSIIIYGSHANHKFCAANAALLGYDSHITSLVDK
jgi:hypothetical protein